LVITGDEDAEEPVGKPLSITGGTLAALAEFGNDGIDARPVLGRELRPESGMESVAKSLPVPLENKANLSRLAKGDGIGMVGDGKTEPVPLPLVF